VSEDGVELTDEMVAAMWAEIASQIEAAKARLEDPEDFVVEPSSQLAKDDIATNPYQVSHCARWCLNAGVDHLHALKSLVIDGGLVHSSAPYGLVRGALENFGAGYWILHPKQRSVRITRGLRWWAENFKDQERATKGRSLANYNPLDPKIAKLVSRAAGAHCNTTTIKGGYSSTAVMQYADKHSSARNPHLVWQLCSGFAHGRPWASLGMNEMHTHPGSEDGVALVRLTSDHKRILGVTVPAVRLLEDLSHLHEKRSGG
jgi:hypothetical protein